MKSHPNHDTVVRQILDSATRAAGQIQKEQGLFARLGRWWELRSERRRAVALDTLRYQRQEIHLARCRQGEHDFQHWKMDSTTRVYEQGQNESNALPVAHRRTWTGRCIHCSAPTILIKNV